ncbi:MAG: SDR family oxidoreductase [Alphaproteobacteria bacterium]|nr:SDR family oxidoreductase [Alphaproteobacteria bacterium]
MTARFVDKVVLITGGASGIGRATAERFASEGATVAIADLNGEMAEDTAAAIGKDGGDARPFEVDLRDEASVLAMSDAVKKSAGPPSVLVACAGIGKTLPLLETDLDTWNETIAVNLTGSFLVAKALLPDMVEAGYGRIVLIGSINSRKALKRRNAYAVSKAGVANLAQLIAVEFAEHGITANCIAPGPVETALTMRMHDEAIRDAYHARLPIKRYGKPEEIAAAAAFLASDEAAYITGHLLDVDGGFDVSGL